MNDEAIDAALSALFARAPDPAPDPAFVARVERAVRAEQALAAARVRAWRRFRGEALATAAVSCVAALLWQSARTIGPGWGTASVTPATLAALILGLWLLVGLRPSWSR